jgi:cytochrome P450
MADPITDEYDPMDPKTKDRLHEFYAALRPTSPVHYYKMKDEAAAVDGTAYYLTAKPTTEFWSLLTYEDCKVAMQTPTVFSNEQGGGPEVMDLPQNEKMLVFADDPQHRHQRQTVNKVFLPKNIDVLLPFISEELDQILDSIQERGQADVMADIATPLLTAISAKFFGVSPDNPAELSQWSGSMMAVMGNPSRAEEAGRALASMFELFDVELSARQATLDAGGTLPEDLLTALMLADFEGRRFTDNELRLAAQQLLVGGIVTTATAIGSGIHLLCSNPAERAKLEADWSLMPNTVEEILRMEPPLDGDFRHTTEPVAMSGCPIPSNAKVRVVYAAANRDPKAFSNPEEFHVDRDLREVRRHFAFATGPHVCVGASLARAEIAIAIPAILTKLAGLQLDPQRPARRDPAMIACGYSNVYITWVPDTTSVS